MNIFKEQFIVSSSKHKKYNNSENLRGKYTGTNNCPVLGLQMS